MHYSSQNLFRLALFLIMTIGSVACATSPESPNSEHVYSVADDHRLENDILRAIRQDAGLVGDRINVEVESRMVTITGKVSNRIHVNRIERILKDFGDDIRGYNIEVEDSRGRF